MLKPAPSFDRIGQPEAERAGRLFLDIDVDDDLVGGGAGFRIDLCFRKEAQCTDAFGGLANFARVEGVAFHSAELAADDLIKRGGVAFDVDAFDKDPLAADDGEFDIQQPDRVHCG